MGEATQQALRRTAQATGKDVTLWYRRELFSTAGWAGLFEPPSGFKAGSPEEYAPGVVNEKFKKDRRVWIVRNEDSSFYALLAICPYSGCTPNWFAIDNKFQCPCHGSGFYRDGTNYEGLAPRPLDRIKISLTSEGQLVVDKGVVYRVVPGRDPVERHPQSVLKVQGGVYTLELERYRLAPYMAQVPPAQRTFVDAQAMLGEMPQSQSNHGMYHTSDEFTQAAQKRHCSGPQIFAGQVGPDDGAAHRQRL